MKRGVFLAVKNILAEIKADLETHLGSKVILKSNRGRNKIVEREGILEQIYPNIFVIKMEERRVTRRISYNYSDVLTEAIEITVCCADQNLVIKSTK